MCTCISVFLLKFLLLIIALPVNSEPLCSQNIFEQFLHVLDLYPKFKSIYFCTINTFVKSIGHNGLFVCVCVFFCFFLNECIVSD